MSDLTLDVDGGYFIHKVGAIIIHDKSVLMVKNENHSYFYPVGGRVNFGETSECAVIREVYEETNVSFEVDRLLYIHENFFVADFLSIDNAPCHELALYYLMKQSDEIENIKCNSVGIDGGTESLHWLPINELSNYELFPDFYKTELRMIGDNVCHFITKDRITTCRK